MCTCLRVYVCMYVCVCAADSTRDTHHIAIDAINPHVPSVLISILINDTNKQIKKYDKSDTLISLGPVNCVCQECCV